MGPLVYFANIHLRALLHGYVKVGRKVGLCVVPGAAIDLFLLILVKLRSGMDKPIRFRLFKVMLFRLLGDGWIFLQLPEKPEPQT